MCWLGGHRVPANGTLPGQAPFTGPGALKNELVVMMGDEEEDAVVPSTATTVTTVDTRLQQMVSSLRAAIHGDDSQPADQPPTAAAAAQPHRVRHVFPVEDIADEIDPDVVLSLTVELHRLLGDRPAMGNEWTHLVTWPRYQRHRIVHNVDGRRLYVGASCTDRVVARRRRRGAPASQPRPGDHGTGRLAHHAPVPGDHVPLCGPDGPARAQSHRTTGLRRPTRPVGPAETVRLLTSRLVKELTPAANVVVEDDSNHSRFERWLFLFLFVFVG